MRRLPKGGHPVCAALQALYLVATMIRIGLSIATQIKTCHFALLLKQMDQKMVAHMCEKCANVDSLVSHMQPQTEMVCRANG